MTKILKGLTMQVPVRGVIPVSFTLDLETGDITDIEIDGDPHAWAAPDPAQVPPIYQEGAEAAMDRLDVVVGVKPVAFTEEVDI